ncbi:MAG: RidA family protein [Planctomycetota bacterium]|nr:RidA family protein [Planctomycetota bacterium]MDA0933775.1 RidA family protein [Planctomycetota bacterium]MDA1222168.1 RidA family protein [Planctomycetota bacterium]
MAQKKPINPESLAEPIGFAHAWLVEGGDTRTLYLAGQCGYDAAGRVAEPGDLVGQMHRAMANIGVILAEAGLAFEDVVQLNFYVTSRDDYAHARRAFGRVWKEFCGRHYPGMAMFQVVSLFDPEARIEIQGIAAG